MKSSSFWKKNFKVSKRKRKREQ